MDNPIVNKSFLLEKYPGKGGWTYALLPNLIPEFKNPFGLVKVRGWIDEFELKHYKLMPNGKGQLFLPVKAAIRKTIHKEAGDWVKIILYLDESPLELPKEILDCFKTESMEALENFRKISEGEQKTYLDWIYQAKKESTKAQRIAHMIKQLLEKKT
ncbi:YdeI/OmpD-associated family protein [Echinicola jeungdonensis]|uniref:DUF1905 domain-containing protein n=1 Tax=Echinicola jeungdonensis TaxID=709343 RepID=A0ABV5J7M3_9BACT|nr:YdeI/OmpD-associated family protein [Echinicola jeungdonensis]MDN3669172.1 YdeI/OmpD-associated family protein [Echinicola jeungdonensis]